MLKYFYGFIYFCEYGFTLIFKEDYMLIF